MGLDLYCNESGESKRAGSYSSVQHSRVALTAALACHAEAAGAKKYAECLMKLVFKTPHSLNSKKGRELLIRKMVSFLSGSDDESFSYVDYDGMLPGELIGAAIDEAGCLPDAFLLARGHLAFVNHSDCDGFTSRNENEAIAVALERASSLLERLASKNDPLGATAARYAASCSMSLEEELNELAGHFKSMSLFHKRAAIAKGKVRYG